MNETPAPSKSAGTLAVGLGALFLSGVLVVVGFARELAALGEYDASGGVVWFVLAALAALVGAVATVMGVHALASNVDELVSRQR